MSVDLPQSIELTRRISNSDSPGETERLQQQRAPIDQRFDPEAAIEGAATYLDIARKRFGDLQLAIASYHMGIGNLENVLRAYARDASDMPIGDLVSGDHLSYAEVFFNSGPDSHRKAYELLRDSATSPPSTCGRSWRPGRSCTCTATTASACRRPQRWRPTRRPMEEVFHPENETDVFQTPDDISDALDDGDLVPLPDKPALGWEPNKDIGELAGQVDQSPELYRALRRRLWRRSPTWPGWSASRAAPRPRCRSTARCATAPTRTSSCSRTSRRPRSTHCTPPAGRSTSAATTSPRSRRAASSISSTTCVDRPARLRGRARRHPRHRLEPGAAREVPYMPPCPPN